MLAVAKLPEGLVIVIALVVVDTAIEASAVALDTAVQIGGLVVAAVLNVTPQVVDVEPEPVVITKLLSFPATVALVPHPAVTVFGAVPVKT